MWPYWIYIWLTCLFKCPAQHIANPFWYIRCQTSTSQGRCQTATGTDKENPRAAEAELVLRDGRLRHLPGFWRSRRVRGRASSFHWAWFLFIWGWLLFIQGFMWRCRSEWVSVPPTVPCSRKVGQHAVDGTRQWGRVGNRYSVQSRKWESFARMEKIWHWVSEWERLIYWLDWRWDADGTTGDW